MRVLKKILGEFFIWIAELFELLIIGFGIIYIGLIILLTLLFGPNFP